MKLIEKTKTIFSIIWLSIKILFNLFQMLFYVDYWVYVYDQRFPPLYFGRLDVDCQICKSRFGTIYKYGGNVLCSCGNEVYRGLVVGRYEHNDKAGHVLKPLLPPPFMLACQVCTEEKGIHHHVGAIFMQCEDAFNYLLEIDSREKKRLRELKL